VAQNSALEEDFWGSAVQIVTNNKRKVGQHTIGERNIGLQDILD
jgi:hypothetical protein